MGAQPQLSWGHLSRRTRVLIKWALGCAAVLGSLMLATKFYEANSYRNALPVELETEGLATTGSVVGPLSGCGGAIFRLTDGARDAIKTKGLAFFTNARQGRGYPAWHPDRHAYVYQPWQETPLPHVWTSEGIWPGLYCIGLDRNANRAIRAAALSPGSYYSTKSRALLLVIPDLGLVIHSPYG